MKRFKFRLEKLLEYRQSIKEERKRELLLKNHALRGAEEHLNQLGTELGVAQLAERGIMEASRVFLADAYRNRLKAEIERQHEVVEERRKESEAAHAQYVEAAREEKALSLLREKKLKEYQEYAQREEDKFLDELTTQKGNTLYEEDQYE